MAFDPKFASNGYFYVYYSASGPRRSVLSRFTAVGDPKTGDRDSELVILGSFATVPQPQRRQIAFGPDGHLYVGLGDGGGSGDPKSNGRNPATLLGSVLRIDVSESTPATPYRIPHDNPMLDRPEARPEIWALRASQTLGGSPSIATRGTCGPPTWGRTAWKRWT